VSLHIVKFIDRIRSTDNKGRKDFLMTMQEAKDLHADITKLLLALEELRREPVKSEEETIQVQITGGNF
jgi:hypothetical protein